MGEYVGKEEISWKILTQQYTANKFKQYDFWDVFLVATERLNLKLEKINIQFNSVVV